MTLMLVACVLLFILCAAVRMSEDGLVGHFSFEEGAGTVVHDRTGRGNDGEIHGAEFIVGNAGHALRFDGVDDYVDFGPAPGLTFKHAVTLSVWVYPEIVPAFAQGVPGKGLLSVLQPFVP